MDTLTIIKEWLEENRKNNGCYVSYFPDNDLTNVTVDGGGLNFEELAKRLEAKNEH